MRKTTSHEVTIVISAYNRAEALNRTLQTVYKQSHRHWRVLIIADCCDENFIRKIDLTNERVKMVNLDIRSGNQYGPNSVGVHLTETPYLAFLNHDDLWLSDHLEIALESMKTNCAGFFLGKAAFCHHTNQELNYKKEGRLAFSEVNHSDELWRMLSGPNWFFEPASAWVIQTELAKRIGHWNKPDAIAITPVLDWLQRAARSGANFCFSDMVTVLKINLHHTSNGENQYSQKSSLNNAIDSLLTISDETLRTWVTADVANYSAKSLVNRYTNNSLSIVKKMLVKKRYQTFLTDGINYYAQKNDQPNLAEAFIRMLRERTGEEFTEFPHPETLIKALLENDK